VKSKAPELAEVLDVLQQAEPAAVVRQRSFRA